MVSILSFKDNHEKTKTNNRNNFQANRDNLIFGGRIVLLVFNILRSMTDREKAESWIKTYQEMNPTLSKKILVSVLLERKIPFDESVLNEYKKIEQEIN